MTRFVAGRLNGVHGEPGTLLGPKSTTRETMVILDNDAEGCTVGYATQTEIDAADAASAAGAAPRSVYEARRPRRW